MLKDPENRYVTLQKLCLPHQNTAQLKPHGFSLYQEFYETGAVKLHADKPIEEVAKIVIENLLQFNHGGFTLQEAWELLQNCGDFQDAWSMVASITEVTRAEEKLEGTGIIDHELPSEPIPELANGDDQPCTNVSSLCSYQLLGENIRPLLCTLNVSRHITSRPKIWLIRRTMNGHSECLHRATS